MIKEMSNEEVIKNFKISLKDLKTIITEKGVFVPTLFIPQVYGYMNPQEIINDMLYNNDNPYVSPASYTLKILSINEIHDIFNFEKDDDSNFIFHNSKGDIYNIVVLGLVSSAVFLYNTEIDQYYIVCPPTSKTHCNIIYQFTLMDNAETPYTDITSYHVTNDSIEQFAQDHINDEKDSVREVALIEVQAFVTRHETDTYWLEIFRDIYDEIIENEGEDGFINKMVGMIGEDKDDNRMEFTKDICDRITSIRVVDEIEIEKSEENKREPLEINSGKISKKEYSNCSVGFNGFIKEEIKNANEIEDEIINMYHHQTKENNKLLTNIMTIYNVSVPVKIMTGIDHYILYCKSIGSIVDHKTYGRFIDRGPQFKEVNFGGKILLLSFNQWTMKYYGISKKMMKYLDPDMKKTLKNEYQQYCKKFI